MTGRRLALALGTACVATIVVVAIVSARLARDAATLTSAPSDANSNATPSAPVAASATASVAAAPSPTTRMPGGIGSTWGRIPIDQQSGVVVSDVVYGGPGPSFVAVGHAAGVHAPARSFVWLSQDGYVWRAADGARLDGALMRSVSTAPAGFVAVGFTGSTNRVWRSADGLRWEVATEVPENDEATMYAVSRGNARVGLVAVGSTPHGPSHRGAIWTSADGSSWSRVPDATMFAQASIEDVVVFRDRLYAVGFVSTTTVGVSPNAAVWSSDDGRTWTAVPRIDGAAGSQMTAVVAGPRVLVAVGSSAAPRGQAAWTSTDGVTWTRAPHAEALAPDIAPGGMRDIIVVDDLFVAVGATGGPNDAMIWTSPDGTTWTRATLAASQRTGSIIAVATSGTRIAAVGASGEVGPPMAWISPP